MFPLTVPRLRRTSSHIDTIGRPLSVRAYTDSQRALHERFHKPHLNVAMAGPTVEIVFFQGIVLQVVQLVVIVCIHG